MTISSPSMPRERRAAALAQLGSGPFTTSRARDAGLTREDLRSRHFKTIMRGVHVVADQHVDHAMRCAAALSVMPPETWVSGVSAAQLLGLPTPSHDGVHVSLPRGVECRRSDVLLARRPTDFRSSTVGVRARVLRVTSPVDLVAELIDTLTFVDAVVLADAVLRRVGKAGVGARWRDGSPRMRRVADAADAGAESPMETRMRLLLLLAGFVGLVIQHEVIIAGRRRRFDLAFPGYRVAVEYDGAHHFASEDQKHLDAIRREEAQAEGWLIVSVVPRGIFTDPAGTVSRVARALKSRGCVTQIDDAWREHFPQRA